MTRPLAACLLALALCAPARASTPDVFGFGSESTSLAGAVTACASDFSAAFYNPAGLALAGAARTVAFGVTGYTSELSIRGARQSISDPLGFELGVRAPVPLGGALRDRIAVGFALHMLPDQIVRVIAHTPEEAFFPYYDNRTQRLVVLPAIAAKVTPRLSLGLGFNFLAGLSGKVQTSQGGTRTLEPRIDEKIFSTVKLHAGVHFDATPKLQLGLAYRQGFSVPFKTFTMNSVAGTDIDINIDAEGLFTPDEVWAGAAFTQGHVRVSLDGGYLRWSAWRGPYVAVSSVLPIAGPFEVTPPAVPYNDIYSVRAGLSWQVLDRDAASLMLRAGGGFEPSPMPDQPGVTNLLDGNKIILSAGAGLQLQHLLPQPVRIDAHVMAHLVQSRTFAKQVFKNNDPNCPSSDNVCGLHDEVTGTTGTQISNVGYPSIDGGGAVVEGGVTLTFAL
jgi:long-chain fatty acid transport protein